ARLDCSRNSLLWHWMRFISSVGCIALALGLHAFDSGAAAADARPVLVAFGDSLTAGFGADPGKSYPDFLQRDLERAGLRWRVVNAGVSGDTTTDGLNRIH